MSRYGGVGRQRPFRHGRRSPRKGQRHGGAERSTHRRRRASSHESQPRRCPDHSRGRQCWYTRRSPDDPDQRPGRGPRRDSDGATGAGPASDRLTPAEALEIVRRATTPLPDDPYYASGNPNTGVIGGEAATAIVVARVDDFLREFGGYLAATVTVAAVLVFLFRCARSKDPVPQGAKEDLGAAEMLVEFTDYLGVEADPARVVLAKLSLGQPIRGGASLARSPARRRSDQSGLGVGSIQAPARVGQTPTS